MGPPQARNAGVRVVPPAKVVDDLRPPHATFAAFPGEAELAALRNWYAGVGALEAVVSRYLGHLHVSDSSARSKLSRIRQRLATHARERNRPDLAEANLERADRGDSSSISRAIETLRWLPLPALTDPVRRWLPPRIVAPLETHGLHRLVDIAVRIPRRRYWWHPISGLGMAGVRRVEALFVAHPEPGERVGAVEPTRPQMPLAPWETLRVPEKRRNGTASARTVPCAQGSLTTRPGSRGSHCARRPALHSSHLLQGGEAPDALGNRRARVRPVTQSGALTQEKSYRNCKQEPDSSFSRKCDAAYRY